MYFKILGGGGGVKELEGPEKQLGLRKGQHVTGILHNTCPDLGVQGMRVARQLSAEWCGQRGKGAWWAGWNCHMEDG